MVAAFHAYTPEGMVATETGQPPPNGAKEARAVDRLTEASAAIAHLVALLNHPQPMTERSRSIPVTAPQ